MPLLILGLAVGTAVLGERYLNRLTMKDAELAPKIGGYNARTVTGLAGLASMLMFGPIGMAIGAGLIGAALGNASTINELQTGVAKLLGGPASPGEVPGPAAVSPLGIAL